MKEIVWVMGHSGVGKETFLRLFSENPDKYLMHQLGWTGLRIGLCDLSIALVPRGHGNQKQDDRDKIVKELENKQILLDVILLKWQAVDTAKGRVKDIAKRFNESATRALVLTAPDAIVQERNEKRERTWRPNNGWQDFLKYEKRIIDKALGEFEIVNYVDTSGGYSLSA